MSPAARVQIDGRVLRLSNLDKVLYPQTGFTKAQVIDYYSRMADVLLPHLAGRPVTLKRYPDGVEGEYFFEKQCPSHRPSWLRVEPVVSQRSARGVVEYCLVDDKPALIWLANLACLEIHLLLAKAENLESPTFMVFDLDPGPPATLKECLEVALQLKEMLDALDLESLPKTSGGKGLHLYVPLNCPGVDFDMTKAFSRSLAELLQERHPESVTANMSKAVRDGKVFIDWSQNDRHKTTVCPYSLRAQARPTVSAPVTWDELRAALEAGEPQRLIFTAGEMLQRVARRGDLFEKVLMLEQRLPNL